MTDGKRKMEIAAEEKLLTAENLMQMLQIGRTALYGLIRRGVIPRPIKLTQKLSRWRQSDIKAILDKLAAQAQEPKPTGSEKTGTRNRRRKC